MISKIRGIKFKGAAFKNETTLQLFSQEETDRASVIFGRNGSGKSTLSRAISKALDSNRVEDIESAQLVDFSNAVMTVSDDDKKRIFVFNEDYTNENIRLQEDGLNTIVMFGDVADIAEKIEQASAILKIAEKEHSTQQEKYNSYTDVTSVQSPDNQYAKLKNALKGDSSWADRERLITGGRTNANVSETVVQSIVGITLSDEETAKTLSTAYDLKYTELQAAKNAGTKIIAAIPTVVDYADTIMKIKDLLAIEVEKPTLTEREKTLLLMVESGETLRLTEIKTKFSTDTSTCPFCLQSVSDNYKFELLESIEKILSKVVEQHKKELRSSKISSVSMDFTAFEVADKDVVDNCKNALDTLNLRIEECNKTIERKIESLYTPITDFTDDLTTSANALKERLNELETKKNEYNKLSGQVATIQNELKELSKKRAYYEVKDIYADYLKQQNEKQREKQKLDNFAAMLKKAKGELEELNQKKKNIKIAEGLINKGLQYVFFTENRLRLVPSGDNYAVLSNGESVKPKNISVGERNILSLCYFFTEILNNIDEKDIYKSECLIVLDDPVSSFDLENRIGIISYLKSQMIKILRGNPNSRVILLSHDLLTVYDIDKALDEIKKQIVLQIGTDQRNMEVRLLELDKHKITFFSRKKRNEYSQLLKVIYEYAKNKSSDYELIIGNVMRRAMEAFGTFGYRKGIDEISCDHSILNSFPEEKRDYFENLMYRLILHGESHLEERVKSLTDNNFFATITADEKSRTAKDVLCLMYQLNKSHIEAHFTAMKDEVGRDVITDIEKWLNAIGDNASKEVSV